VAQKVAQQASCPVGRFAFSFTLTWCCHERAALPHEQRAGAAGRSSALCASYGRNTSCSMSAAASRSRSVFTTTFVTAAASAIAAGVLLALDLSEVIEKQRPLHITQMPVGRDGWKAAGGLSHYCLFLVAAGGAGRTSAHGSDFFFSISEGPLIADW